MQWRGVIVDDKALRITGGFPGLVGTELPYEAEADEDVAEVSGFAPARLLKPGVEVTFFFEGMVGDTTPTLPNFASRHRTPRKVSRAFQKIGLFKGVKGPKKKELLIEFVGRKYVSGKNAEAHRAADHVLLLKSNRASAAVSSSHERFSGCYRSSPTPYSR